jgi:hypothetical protein
MNRLAQVKPFGALLGSPAIHRRAVVPPMAGRSSGD